jgi:hypothetical protein
MSQDTRRQTKFNAFERNSAVDIVMRPDGRGLHGLLSWSSSEDSDWLSTSIKKRWVRTQMGTKIALVNEILSRSDTMNAKPDCSKYLDYQCFTMLGAYYRDQYCLDIRPNEQICCSEVKQQRCVCAHRIFKI